MRNSRKRFRSILLGGTILVAAALLAFFPHSAAAAGSLRPQAMKPHMDHHPKHGGIFFMALDRNHHLEGVLLPTGTFCVYVYDAYTKPVTPAQLRRVSATVIWGDDDNAPRTRMIPASDGRRLESRPPGGRPKLPITLTLLAHFPGESLKARPELFTFPFKGFIADGINAQPSSSEPSPHHPMQMAEPHEH
jgi:hypothetical protein